MADELGYQFKRVYAAPIEDYRQVATIAERDAIPTGVRYEGLLCYVTSEDTDYQLKGGITNIDWEAAGGGGNFDTGTGDSDDITEGVTNLFLTAAERAKLAWISITQAVDLDQLEIDVAALSSGLVWKDEWDASSGSFPGGGVTAIGDMYTVTVAGTVDGVSFGVGDSVVAKVVNASTTTFSGNWIKIENQAEVVSVAGLTGAITKPSLLSALNVEDGATADQTGAEIAVLLNTELGSSDWQTKRTQEEIEDFIDGLISAGTHSRVTITYSDAGGTLSFVVDPIFVVYADLATLISNNGTHTEHTLYEITDASGFTSVSSGIAWVKWLGTTDGDEDDYQIISKTETAVVPAPIPSTYADLTALITAQGSQTTNYVYEVTDGSGFTGITSGIVWVKYLGTTVGTEADYRIVSTENIDGGSA